MSSYWCSACGYHPDNTATWCAKGCGSDYNEMIEWYEPVEGVDYEDAGTIRFHDQLLATTLGAWSEKILEDINKKSWVLDYLNESYASQQVGKLRPSVLGL